MEYLSSALEGTDSGLSLLTVLVFQVSSVPRRDHPHRLFGHSKAPTVRGPGKALSHPGGRLCVALYPSIAPPSKTGAPSLSLRCLVGALSHLARVHLHGRLTEELLTEFLLEEGSAQSWLRGHVHTQAGRGAGALYRENERDGRVRSELQEGRDEALYTYVDNGIRYHDGVTHCAVGSSLSHASDADMGIVISLRLYGHGSIQMLLVRMTMLWDV